MVKVDLHLHSEASNRPGGYISEKLKIGESYTKPKKLYNTLMNRGMTLFTITDHDTIDGCLEIAHLPNVFISEEITTYFPEDRCKVHVIAIDITQKQHDDIQHLRGNIYELVDYLQFNNITHILAHPLYNMDGKLNKTHIERFLLLFDNWEILNGTRSKTSSIITKKIAKSYTKEDLEKLANKYGFFKRRRDFISFTGGSDDHGGLDLGYGYTIAEGDSVEDLKKAIENGQTKIEGYHGNPKRLTHMVMNIAKEGMKKRYNLGNLGYLLDTLFEPKETSKYSFLDSILGKSSVATFIENVINFKGVLSENPHENIFYFFSNMLPYTLNQIKSMKSFDFDKLSAYIGRSVIFLAPYIAYLSVYKQRADEKNISKKFYKEFFNEEHTEGKVAYFSDTFFDINGVARTTQKLLELSKEESLNIKFIISDERIIEDSHIKNFKPMISFALPEYQNITVNIPNLLEILDYIESENFDIIYAATPGVIGVYALVIAKILGIPFVSAYHTDFPEYALRYTNEPYFKYFAEVFMKSFYGLSDRVLVPSLSYYEKLLNYGIKEDKLKIFKRGVNRDKFNETFKDKEFWKMFDPTYRGEKVIAYVGRVAKEKDLDTFVEVFELLKEERNIKFAIVGDGPYKYELEKVYKDRIIFTGFLEGEGLSKAYASADIFLFPSTTETFGNVVLEAMASGIVPLVPDVGGAKEHITHGENGFIIKQNNPLEYAYIIKKLLDDDILYKEVRQKAIAYASMLNERELLLEMIQLLSFGRVKSVELSEETLV